jgi:putative effector of murein hydrolase
MPGAELTTENRVWRTVIRVTWLSAALMGVAVASIPAVRFTVVVAATLLAGAGAFAFMIWSAKTKGVSLRRPARIKQSRRATAVIIVLAGLLGGLIGATFSLVFVVDAPPGLVLPMAVALGGIGAEILGRLGLRLARRSPDPREAGSPT